jgi:hypothetical protein
MEEKINGYDTVIFMELEGFIRLPWIVSGLLTDDKIAEYTSGHDNFTVIFLKRNSKRHHEFKKWFRKELDTQTYKSL